MSQSIAVVGATGSLGGRVVRELIARGKAIRALVRSGTDSAALAKQGVQIVPGDMLDPSSLDRLLEGAGAIVTSAIGYSHRKPADSLASVDDLGNRNLVDAAKRARIGCFIFTSILTCDKAKDVPHFWQKKLIEDYLESSGLPFVALRPGAFLSAQWWARGLEKGHLQAMGSATARWTYIHPDDVARCLALAVDAPGAVGRRIDLGMDRPVSAREIAEVCERLLARKIRVRAVPAALIFGLAGLFNPRMRDFGAMVKYFLTGNYVADTAAQREFFGPVPTVEDSLRRALAEAGFMKAA